MDNQSFASTDSESQVSTASTSSLLPNAPGVTRENKPHHLVLSKGNIRRQKYRPNASLEQLKKSLDEKEKESLLAAHLTSKALGTLAKVKRNKKNVKSKADSDDLSEQLQRLRDDLSTRTSNDHATVHISGRLKLPGSQDDLFSQKRSRKSSKSIKGESQDDSYLIPAGKHRDFEELELTSPHSEWPYIRGSRHVPSGLYQGPPSWVEDLAASERSSTVNFAGGDYLAASSGRALSLDDLSPDKEPSRVLRDGINRDISRHGVSRLLSAKHQAESTKTADDTDFDVVSLTTDDLCFAAPDASNLKSILRTPTSTPKKRQTRLSSSTDDLITESLNPYQVISPSKTSPSRLGVRFHLNDDMNHHELNGGTEPMKNQVHRDYIRQLMRDIEESESVTSALSLNDRNAENDMDCVKLKDNELYEKDRNVTDDVNSLPGIAEYSKGKSLLNKFSK